MGLETATFIEDLVASNPLGTDGKSQGDNHLRLVKSVLQSQFPNLGAAAVNATAAELNNITDNNRQVPTGAIVMWSGTIAAIPTGWLICDGTFGTPNLVSRFVVGSDTDTGGTFDIGETGGSSDTPSSTTDSHALTISQMPAHNHKGDGGDNLLDTTTGLGVNTGFSGGQLVKPIETEGGGTGHTHGISAVSNGNLPPFFALAYIMKS